MSTEQVRVLVVEDHTDTADALAAHLTLDGYTVRCCASGEDAMHCARDFEPHFVLVDLRLPGLGGAELAAQFRSLYGVELVIVAVTGSTSLMDHELAEAAGVDFVLIKPVGPNQLRRFLPPLAHAVRMDAKY